MINSLKTIGVISSALAATYRRTFCYDINCAAKACGLNVVYFNFIGKIGGFYPDYAAREDKLIDIIPYDELAGIIFDDEAFNYREMADHIVERLRERAKCPVISVTGFREGFINILYNDCCGVREMVRHMTQVHNVRRIGYMSGPLVHPDAARRYEAFKETMVQEGLPENGVGMFEGDFWYNKGVEAADFFWNKCGDRPEAIICGNDYMAMSLCDAFREMGVNVPKDIIVAGFDGAVEGENFIPSISTTDRRRKDIAYKAVEIIDCIIKGKPYDINAVLHSSNIYRHSCGCMSSDPNKAIKKVNSSVLSLNRSFIYFLAHIETATLQNNSVENIGELTDIFVEHAINFGEYETFFFMMYLDDEENTSYETAMEKPSKRVVPAMWIDKGSGKLKKPDKPMETSRLIPDSNDSEPQFYYINDIHSGSKCFGYTCISMTDDAPFNDFYSAWILNISVSMESLFKRTSIDRLIADLEYASIRDELTGLFNRRGFERKSAELFGRTQKDALICTVVIDMDGLKGVNDVYGHSEGDYAIRMLGRTIAQCCEHDEIAGRTGGDEFYIFAADYSPEKLDTFINSFERRLEELNAKSEKPYKIGASLGSLIEKASVYPDLEDFLRVSDERMYEIKRRKRSGKNSAE